MNSTLQIRVDKKVKDKAQKTFKAMGLDMSSGVKLFLNEVINSGAIPFPITCFNDLPQAKREQLLEKWEKEAQWALKYGKHYKTAEEAHDAILGKR
ncbi:MAG: type II toxin-antitoxin system RelB/DinJ family antitoxin [bacterium]|nr:type II toxin-antitoxin system RelB/DinJ family antitoxin [bacterium]